MNKLMARIVAVVLAVMMLGTVSFAANLNAANNLIPENEEVKAAFNTVWTVKATTDTNVIVAMYQDDEAPGAIAINPAKLGDSKFVTVEYSGGNVTEADQIKKVKLYVNKNDNKQDITVADTITLGEGENKKTYGDVAFVTNTFNAAGKSVSKLGYILKDASKGDAAKANEFAYSNTVFTGKGDITYSVLIYGVPAEAEIVADQVFEYVVVE